MIPLSFIEEVIPKKPHLFITLIERPILYDQRNERESWDDLEDYLSDIDEGMRILITWFLNKVMQIEAHQSTGLVLVPTIVIVEITTLVKHYL